MSKKININVNVADKVASAIGAPCIVCGNSNYTITFTLDPEWETSNAKTARFVFRRDGEVKYLDVAFSGRVVAVPELANIDEVYVGLYAGELYTSTPARIICKKSIKCGTQQKQEAPAPDVYQQILQTINNLDTLPTVTDVDAGRALMVNEDGRWVVRLPNFIYDQNSGELMTFFIGTIEEWNAWTGDKAKCIFFPTDLNLLDEVEAEFEKLWADAETRLKGLDFYRGLITVRANISAVKQVIAKFQMDGLFEMPAAEFTASVFYDLLKARAVHFLSGYTAEQNTSSGKWTYTPLVSVWVASDTWGQNAYVYFGHAGDSTEIGFPPYVSCHVSYLTVSILQSGDHIGEF